MSTENAFLCQIVDGLPMRSARVGSDVKSHAEILELEEKRDKLEQRAAIAEKTKKLWSIVYHSKDLFGNSDNIVRFLLGWNSTDDREWAKNYDECRKGVRDAYFSVSDVELRKALIEAQLAVENKVRSAATNFVALARTHVNAAAELPALEFRWPLGKFYWLIVVAGLYAAKTFGGPFWLIGVAILFLGILVETGFKAVGTQLERAHSRQIELKQALADYEDASWGAGIIMFWPHFFSANEPRDGERDAEWIDKLSATTHLCDYPIRIRSGVALNDYRKTRWEGR